MNPNATPFYPTRKTTYASVLGEQFTHNQTLAVYAPLAPIEDLSDGQKVQQQVSQKKLKPSSCKSWLSKEKIL
jgi:hypothetical protein